VAQSGCVSKRILVTGPTDVFGNSFANLQASRLLDRLPDLLIVEQTDEGYTCRVPTPGVKRNQLQLSLQGDCTVELTVKSSWPRSCLAKLAKQLQEERTRFEEAATELHGARREEWHKRASVRRPLALTDER
jgi:hypothetical protein